MHRNVELDNLRAIGIFFIVAYHIAYLYFPAATNFLLTYGIPTTLVDTSFVISGYVISCILIPSVNQLKTNNADLIAFLKSFAVKRLFRIYPSLWAVFFFVLILTFIFSNETKIFSTPFNTIQAGIMLLTSSFNFFFISNYSSLALSPYWSLALEEQFYLFFPLFLLLTKNNQQRTRIYIGMILLITFILRPLSISHFEHTQALYFTQSRCDALIYGCLIYMLSQQPWFPNLRPKFKRTYWQRYIFMAVIYIVIIGVSELGYSPAVYLTLANLASAVLVTTAIFESNIITFPAIVQKAMDLLAARSYAVYVIHVPTLLLVDTLISKYAPPLQSMSIAKTAIAVPIILFFNEILYRFVLLPFLLNGKKLANSMVEKKNESTDIDDEAVASPVRA